MSSGDMKEHLLHLKRVIEQAVPEAVEKTRPVYMQEEVLTLRRDVGFPVLGVLYSGLVPRGPEAGKRDSSKGWLACSASFDVIVVTGPVRDVRVSGLDLDSLTILQKLRSAIGGEKGSGASGWRFISETPTPFVSDMLTYLQRWSVGVRLEV